MFAVWTRPQPLSSDGVTLTAQPRHVDHDNHGCPPQDAQHQGPSSLQTSPAHAESLWCSEPHEKVPENPHCITKAYVTQPLCTKNVCIFHIWNFTIHDTCMIYIVIKCFMCFYLSMCTDDCQEFWHTCLYLMSFGAAQNFCRLKFMQYMCVIYIVCTQYFCTSYINIMQLYVIFARCMRIFLA